MYLRRLLKNINLNNSIRTIYRNNTTGIDKASLNLQKILLFLYAARKLTGLKIEVWMWHN